jgi:hypothetical protein
MRNSHVARRSSRLASVVAALLIAACGSTPVASNVPSPGASNASPVASSVGGTSTASAGPSVTSVPSASPSVVAVASTAPSSTPRPSCNSYPQNKCLGPLTAGTYSTYGFDSPFSYTVPAGWGNYEDLPGNFLLLPPGGDLVGVDGGTSDYLGVYASVAASGLVCGSGPAAGVELSASAIAHALSTRPGLSAAAPKAASVGGLKGEVITVTMKKGWTHNACGGGPPSVTLLVGVPPSDFDHGIASPFAVRMYLLDSPNGVLAIEIDDITGGKHLATYDGVVKSMRFGTG